MEQDKLLTVAETSSLLGVSLKTVYRYLDNGKIRGNKIGNIIVIPKDEVLKIQKAKNKKEIKGFSEKEILKQIEDHKKNIKDSRNALKRLKRKLEQNKDND